MARLTVVGTTGDTLLAWSAFGLQLLIPSGIQPGDLMVAWFTGRKFVENGKASPTATGWTTIPEAESSGARVAWKIATESDLGGGLTSGFSAGDSGPWHLHWRLVVLRGVAASNPLVTVAAGVGAVTTGTNTLSFTAPALTVGRDVTVVELVSSWSYQTPQSQGGDGGARRPTPQSSPSGVLVSDGLVFDRRGPGSLYAEGFWQLAVFDHAGGAVPTRQWDTAGSPATTVFQGPGEPTVVALAVAPNAAPYAPQDLSPASGATIPPTQGTTLTWKPSDPDPGDTQSAYEVQWRPYGTETVTSTGQVPRSTSRHVMPGGTWAEGEQGEWRVRTADAEGKWGPWAPWQQFTAAFAPDTPGILSPASESSHAGSAVFITWSTPEQEAYRVRSVADLNDAPDLDTVYFDTGVVPDGNARTVEVPLPVNQRSEWLVVEVQRYGLWSQPATLRIHVDRTLPPTPTGVQVIPDPANGALRVTWDPPVSAVDEPEVVGVHVYVNGGPEGELPVAMYLPPTHPFTWWLPVSGVDYLVRVDFLGDNTAISTSGWTAATTPQVDYHYGGSYA